MDTDDLTEETYAVILIEAEEFNHDLTLQFGVLSYECDDEEMYISKALELLDEFEKMDEEEYEDIFFDDIPDRNSLLEAINKIRKNIEEVQKIPYDQRTPSF